MATSLTASRRSELRAQAHKLSPVVIIGDKGLTDEVVTEIDRSLKAHELIKVRAATDDRAARSEWMRAICTRLAAHPVQEIGKMLVVYRENPAEGKGSRVEGKAKSPSASSPPPSTSTRTSRPRSRTPSPRPESGPRRRRPSTSR